MISVMIADDHGLVAEGLRKIVNESGEAQVVGMATSLSETREKLLQLKPQVLFLDVAFPDGDGIDKITHFLSVSPDTQIIVISMFAEAAVVHRAMQAGAKGYLFKSAGVEEVRNAILTVEAGETYLSAEAQQMLSHEKQTPANLTMREREILGLIAEGCTMKDIADRLCLGFETVHSYT